MNDVHLLLYDAALSAGFICLGAPEDHEAMIGLGELGVVLRGGVRWLIGLWGWLLGLALLAEGATDVALDGGAILEEVLHLPSMERAGGFECLLKVLGVRTVPWAEAWRCGQPWPPSPPFLVSLVTAMLGQSWVIVDVPAAEVTGGFYLVAEVGLDGLLTGGILGGDV
jgi:hypothetical protein